MHPVTRQIFCYIVVRNLAELAETMSYEIPNTKKNYETRYIFTRHHLLYFCYIFYYSIFHPTTLAAMAEPDTNISPPSHRAITENMKENVKVLNNILHKTQHKIAKHR